MYLVALKNQINMQMIDKAQNILAGRSLATPVTYYRFKHSPTAVNVLATSFY